MERKHKIGVLLAGYVLYPVMIFAQENVNTTLSPETAALVAPKAPTATRPATVATPVVAPNVAKQVDLPPLPPPPSAANNSAPMQVATPQIAAPQVTSTFGTVEDPAFQNVIKKTFPMTPEQIAALRMILQENQRSAAAPAESPTPTLSTQTVILTPGSTPPVMRLANGYVSSVVFLDETGQPWPISGYTIGNPQVFNINWDGKSNILMMQGVGRYETGNIAVQLTGLATPIMLTIVSDQSVVDYRIDFRVSGRGPYAKAPLIGGTLPRQANSVLMDLLEGVPPMGSTSLLVTGGPAQAWISGDKMYVRTPLNLLSPGWDATLSSIDGTKAYEMNVTPMLLASQDGQTVTLRIEGF